MASSNNLASLMSALDLGTFNSNSAICERLAYFFSQINSEEYNRQICFENTIRSRTHAAIKSSSEATVKNEKNQLQVMLYVSHFKPSEIEVKVVDNYIVIHGKHEEITDEHGFIKREFKRRCMLPEGAEAETVKASLIADGVLTIEVPKKVIEAHAPNERVVPILLFSEKETSG